MNLGELKARVRDALQAEEDDLRYTDAKISLALNEGAQDLVVRAGCLLSQTAFETRAYDYQYALPTTCVNILRVYETEDTKRKIWPVTTRNLDDVRRNWRQHTSTKLEWYFRFSLEWMFVGPRPSTAGVEYTVTFTEDPGRNSMILDTDQPDCPVRFREALVDYAEARMLLEGGRGGEMTQRAIAKLKLYEAGVARCRDAVFHAVDRMNRFDQGWPTAADYGVVPS